MEVPLRVVRHRVLYTAARRAGSLRQNLTHVVIENSVR
jgi:hypothetical protein